MDRYIITSKQDFTALYRFGKVPMNKLGIVDEGDKTDIIDEIYETFKSITFFNNDEDYIIIKTEVNKTNNNNYLRIEDVLELIPLTRAAKNSFELKFNRNIHFSTPRFERLFYKIEAYIDIEDKVKGIDALSKILLPDYLTNEIVSKEIITKVREARISGKKSHDLKREDFFTHLLVYDRYKFFPKTNLGYLYDVGEILAHSKGAGERGFKGSGLYNYFEENKVALNGKKVNDLIQNIEKAPEAEPFIKHLTEENGTKKYVSALLYLKFKDYLLESDSIMETDIVSFSKKIIEMKTYTKELIEAVNLLGAFFGYQKFYDDYYASLNLAFFKSPKPKENKKDTNQNIVTGPQRSEEKDKMRPTKNITVEKEGGSNHRKKWGTCLIQITNLLGEDEVDVKGDMNTKLKEIVKHLNPKATNKKELFKTLKKEFSNELIADEKKAKIKLKRSTTLLDN